MKAKIITLISDSESVNAANTCISSGAKHDLFIEKHIAVVAFAAQNTLNEWSLRWNYPWNGDTKRCLETGITKVGYQTLDPAKRIACFLSHYELWRKCVRTEEDYIIFEHDALVTKPIDFDVIHKSNKQVIALNEPQAGATPRADVYKQRVESLVKKRPSVVDVPYVFEDITKPAGLPGNSAYYIKPDGAKKLLKLVELYGAWPNDAIMCKQLMRNSLGIYYPYATKVQGVKSTTTL